MNWTQIGITIATIGVGLGLYAFGNFYHDPTFQGFSYTLIGGAIGYVGGLMHAAAGK